MYSLASGFCEWYFHKPEYHFLMLGLDGSGKTSILERIKHELGDEPDSRKRTGSQATGPGSVPQLAKITPTVGLNIARLEVKGVKTIIWDLGGQLELRSIWDKYYPDSHALIWVIDCSDPARFEEAKDTLESVLQQPELNGIPLLILANKSEQLAAIGVEDIRRCCLGKEPGGARRQVKVMAASAWEGRGVVEGVHWLVDAVKHGTSDRSSSAVGGGALSAGSGSLPAGGSGGPGGEVARAGRKEPLVESSPAAGGGSPASLQRPARK